MRPDDIMNIGQRAATEQDSIENELIAENKRLRDELRILRDVVRELEAHLESLQNRYALVTAENARLQAVILDAGDALKNIAQDMGAGRYAKAMAQAALNALKEKDDGDSL